MPKSTHSHFRVLFSIVGVILVCVCVLAWLITQPSFILNQSVTAPSNTNGDKLDQTLKPQVLPDTLQKHVKHLSHTLYPRSFDHPAKLRLAAQYIYDQFSSTGATLSWQPVMVDGQTFYNVIARFGPAQGKLIVIGAHYDSHGHAQAAANTPKGYSLHSHTPGADDNASGVAGLIELAQLLGKHPPKTPVELVAYTLEEPPNFRTDNMGSAWHAKHLKEHNADVAFMLSLEMIGYFSDEPNSQTFPVPGLHLLYPNQGNFIALVSQMSDFGLMRQFKHSLQTATTLPVHSINAPASLVGVDFSDHRSYWAQGYPAIMVTDTAFYRNTAYHMAEDTFERLDYSKMAQVVLAVYSVVQSYVP